MKLIIDTNLWVSSCFGKQSTTLQDILLNPHCEVYVCNKLIHEVMEVLSRPKFSKYISADDINDTYALLTNVCKHASIKKHANSIIRDNKDLYLLSFAETVKADVILSGDKDLLVLGTHKQTKIMSIADFKMLYL
jgi:hypothetical protein